MDCEDGSSSQLVHTYLYGTWDNCSCLVDLLVVLLTPSLWRFCASGPKHDFVAGYPWQLTMLPMKHGMHHGDIQMVLLAGSVKIVTKHALFDDKPLKKRKLNNADCYTPIFFRITVAVEG